MPAVHQPIHYSAIKFDPIISWTCTFIITILQRVTIDRAVDHNIKLDSNLTQTWLKGPTDCRIENNEKRKGRMCTSLEYVYYNTGKNKSRHCLEIQQQAPCSACDLCVFHYFQCDGRSDLWVKFESSLSQVWVKFDVRKRTRLRADQV